MNWILTVGAVVAILGLAVYYYLMIVAKDSPQKQLGKDFTMPDVRMHYKADTLYDTFSSAGEAGRPNMRRYWLYDFGLMLCLTGVMLAVTANIASSRSWLFYLMLALTVVRTLVDALEDGLLLRLLRQYPKRNNGLASFAGYVTTLKHSLLIAWIAILFLLLMISAFSGVSV